MEEQVIQEFPVETPAQPVAGTDTAPQPDQSAQLRAEYEGQLAALKNQAVEAEENSKASKPSSTRSTKSRTTSARKRWKTKASGRISGRKPTKPPKKKTFKSPN
jgi:uncharacterized protein YgiM (DUF1202 family)